MELPSGVTTLKKSPYLVSFISTSIADNMFITYLPLHATAYTSEIRFINYLTLIFVFPRHNMVTQNCSKCLFYNCVWKWTWEWLTAYFIFCIINSSAVQNLDKTYKKTGKLDPKKFLKVVPQIPLFCLVFV